MVSEAERSLAPRVAIAALSVAVVAACTPIDRSSGVAVLDDWSCPELACGAVDAASTCIEGACASFASDADVVVAIRLPTTSNIAPGAVAVSVPSSSATCKSCVSLPSSFPTEHGILVAREVAAGLGWANGADIVVPATVAVEALVDGILPLGELLPEPLAPLVLERSPKPLRTTLWRSPTGGEPYTSRALLFGGRYRRTLEPIAPFDSELPPFSDKVTVQQGENMHAVGPGRLALVTVPRVELPPRFAGWTLHLADANGVRRSSRLRVTSMAGSATFRIDTAVTPDPFPLDLVIIPGDEGLMSPRLVVPAPTALRRVAYPSAFNRSRVTVRVLDGAGLPRAGAVVTFRVRELDSSPFGLDGVFSLYASGTHDVVTGPDGTALVDVPYGSFDAFARMRSDDTLEASTQLPFFFARESATINLRAETARIIEGRCAFVGGKTLGGAAIEAVSIDDRAGPSRLGRTIARTDADGSFRLALPPGSFAFWLLPPPGTPLQRMLLAIDVLGLAGRTEIPCTLEAPARRELRILDSAPLIGAPVSPAIVETFRVRSGRRPAWLGEGITRADGRVTTFEVP